MVWKIFTTLTAPLELYLFSKELGRAGLTKRKACRGKTFTLGRFPGNWNQGVGMRGSMV